MKIPQRTGGSLRDGKSSLGCRSQWCPNLGVFSLSHPEFVRPFHPEIKSMASRELRSCNRRQLDFNLIPFPVLFRCHCRVVLSSHCIPFCLSIYLAFPMTHDASTRQFPCYRVPYDLEFLAVRLDYGFLGARKG